MCAENNAAMNATVNDIFKYNSDYLVREQCEAREAYYAGEAYKKQKMENLEKKNMEQAEQIASQNEQITQLQEKNKYLESLNNV